MKKTLKLVGIFAAILVVGFTGGLSVYFLIQNNKTYHIFDLRFVTPVAAAPTYIYMNEENVYDDFKNQTVYMTANKDNRFEIAVFALSSNNTREIDIVSSNEAVAEIIYDKGKAYVKYKQAGEATITASIAGVISDSFDLYVYNKAAKDFTVYDRTYYGKYAELEQFENKVVAYADDLVYEYDIVSNSIFSEEDNDAVNFELLQVDKASVDNTIFESVVIDPSTKKLKLQCKSSLSKVLTDAGRTDYDTAIAIQSYYYSEQGDVKKSEPYIVDVHVIADTPEFLQMIVSATPDFANSYVFMDTKDFKYATEEQIIANIDGFLSYQKAEQYLGINGEISTYNVFFTDKVTEVYVKFRKVYTNGDIVDLNPITADYDEANPYTIKIGGEDLTNSEDSSKSLVLSQNKKYYTLRLDEADFTNPEKTVTLTVQLGDFVTVVSDFVFEFKEFTAENVEDFYDYMKKTNSFVYTYWDLRTPYYNEISDAAGNIIGFGGIVIDYESLTPMDPEVPGEDAEGEEDGEEEEPTVWFQMSF